MISERSNPDDPPGALATLHELLGTGGLRPSRSRIALTIAQVLNQVYEVNKYATIFSRGTEFIEGEQGERPPGR